MCKLFFSTVLIMFGVSSYSQTDTIYYSINDIDKRVKGKSLKILSQSNIKVKKGLLKKEVTEHYDSYFTNKINPK